MKNRREFFKTSAAFMGVLSAFGLLGNTADGQPEKTPKGEKPPQPVVKADVQTLRTIMEEAIRTADMEATLRKFKGKIPPSQEAALRKLTPQDLANLRDIQNKTKGADTQIDGWVGVIVW